ncbi:MAG: hypothetical protein J7L91_01100 [Candidatus Korarchaeota archaeon]|nr:hypothetical protein [Candidatus Korarchaeota archaeon]
MPIKGELVNLTPHEIALYVDGEVIKIPPSGKVARLETEKELEFALEVQGSEVLVRRVKYKEVNGLPEPRDGIFYITSLAVAQAVHRNDIIVPDTSDAIRDEKGRILGVKGFIRV